MGHPESLTALNLLLLFMAFAASWYPILIRVLPAPGFLGSGVALMLSLRLQPLSGYILGSLPAVFSGNSSEL